MWLQGWVLLTLTSDTRDDGKIVLADPFLELSNVSFEANFGLTFHQRAKLLDGMFNTIDDGEPRLWLELA